MQGDAICFWNASNLRIASNPPSDVDARYVDVCETFACPSQSRTTWSGTPPSSQREPASRRRSWKLQSDDAGARTRCRPALLEAACALAERVAEDIERRRRFVVVLQVERLAQRGRDGEEDGERL